MTPEEWNALAQLRARHGPGSNAGPNVHDAGHYDTPSRSTARLEALVKRIGNGIDAQPRSHFVQTMGEPS